MVQIMVVLYHRFNQLLMIKISFRASMRKKKFKIIKTNSQYNYLINNQHSIPVHRHNFRNLALKCLHLTQTLDQVQHS
jgi:hypothetical protein